MHRVASLIAVCGCVFSLQPALAEGPALPELLPPTTVFYAEVAQPADLIDTVADHPLIARIQKSPQYLRATNTPQFFVARLVLGGVKAQLQQDWQPALKAAFGGGMCAAFDAKTQGAVLILRAEDPAALERLVNTLLKLARDDAQKKDKPDPVREDTFYRDVHVYRLEKGAFALHKGTLVATNNAELGRFVLDRLLDGGAETLAANGVFQQAASTRASDATLWTYLDLEPIRSTVKDKNPLASGRTENPLAELLVGGMVDTFRKAPFVTGALALGDEGLSLSFAAPFDREWISESRRYYFGDEDADAPPPVHVEETLLTLGSYRDISEMWLRNGDLLEQNASDNLAKADSVLTTLFSGKDFGEDVLGAIGPRVQFVVARQTYPEGQPQPAVKLPSFAIVGQLKDPETMRPDFRRTFLSLIGFVNITGAMEGRPQFDFEIDDEGDDQIVATRYVVDADRKELDNAPIYWNFSPSIAFVGDRIVISTTEQLARDLRRALHDADDATSPQPNTLVEVEVPPLYRLLIENREQFIAKNMLDKGHDRQEAEREIDTFLAIVGLFQDAKLSLETKENQMELRLNIDWAE